jgi:uncharacterized lipoprotein YddW (UPF0748 family)
MILFEYNWNTHCYISIDSATLTLSKKAKKQGFNYISFLESCKANREQVYADLQQWSHDNNIDYWLVGVYQKYVDNFQEMVFALGFKTETDAILFKLSVV